MLLTMLSTAATSQSQNSNRCNQPINKQQQPLQPNQPITKQQPLQPANQQTATATMNCAMQNKSGPFDVVAGCE